MNRWRQIIWTVVGIAASLMVIAVVTTAFVSARTLAQVRNTQIDGTPTGKAILKTGERIESCTTPGQECYERGQRQTATAVANINHVVILAAACSTTVPADRPAAVRENAIQQCVIAQLAAEQPSR